MGGTRRASVSDHACWAYSSDEERGAIATAWLREGLAMGQRALYVGDGSFHELADELLGGLPGAHEALDTGALLVTPVGELYDFTASIAATAQLDRYADVVDEAIVNGYRGVRVAADITPLIMDPARRDAHLRWEQVADRYMTGHPFAPLCMYDTRRVSGFDAIACVHPLHGPDHPMFALYGDDAATAALDGETDACVAPVLAEVLRTIPTTDEVLDLTRLSFIDAHCAWVLQDELSRRREAGQVLRLIGPSHPMRKLWEFCGFDASLLAAA